MEEAEAVEFSPSYRILEATDESEDDLHHSSGRTKQEPKSSGKQMQFNQENPQQELELEEESFFERSKKKGQSGGKQFDDYGHASYNMSFSSSPNPAIPRPTKFSEVGEQYNQQQLQSPVEEELPRVNMKIERIDQYNYQLKGKNLMSSFEDATTYPNQIQQFKPQENNMSQEQQSNNQKSEANSRNSFNKSNQQQQYQLQQKKQQEYSPDKDSQEDETSQRKLSVEPMKLIDQEGMLGKNTISSQPPNTLQTDLGQQIHLSGKKAQQDVYSSENDRIQMKSFQNKNNSGQVLNDQVKQIISKRNAAEQQQYQYQQAKNMSFMQKSDYSSEWGYQRDEELKEQQKQIGELEQALRIETLNFEEAKRCIQILRNALSQKLEEQTIKKLIEDTASKARMNKVDLYTFISTQSRNGEDERDRVSEKQLKLMKEQMARIEEFNDSLSVDLKNAIYALQIAEDEKAAALQAQKLAMFEQNSHEKDQLLDYLTDYKKQIDSLQQETLLLREQIDISHGSRRNNNQDSNEIHRDQSEKNVLDDENGEKDDQEHKSHESSFNDHSIVQQRTLETNLVKSENTGLITRLLSEVKEAIEKGKGGQNLTQKHSRLVDVTSKLMIEAQHLDDLTKELKNLLESERQQHSNEIKETFKQLTAAREENRSNKEQYSQLEQDHENILEQIEQYKEVVQEKQDALEKSNEKLLKIREAISDRENEISELKEQVESSQKNIEDLNIIIQEYLDQIDSLKQQLNASSSPNHKSSKQSILDPSLGIQQLHEQDQFQEIIKKQKMDVELLEAQTRLSNLEGQVEEMENEIQIKQAELSKQEELRLTTQETYEAQIEELKSHLEEKDRRIQSQNESSKKEIEQLTKVQTDMGNQRQKERNQLTEEVKRMLSYQLESQKDIWSSLIAILPNFQSKNAVSDLIEVQMQISQLDIQKALNTLALNQLELQTADSSNQSLNHVIHTQIQALKHTLLLLDESKAPLISRKLALINATHQQSTQGQISAEMVANLQEDLADARDNLSRLTKEMELKQISAKSVQNAYNDLLQEYGRLLSQSLLNAPGKSVVFKQQQFTAAPFSASKSPQKLTLSCNLSSAKILQPAQPDQNQVDSMGLRFPKRQLDTLPLNSRYESSHFSLNEHSNNQTVRVSKDLSPQEQ